MGTTMPSIVLVNSGGAITGVTAGTGLAGGGTLGSVTLSILQKLSLSPHLHQRFYTGTRKEQIETVLTMSARRGI